jgi:hypothetical protein
MTIMLKVTSLQQNTHYSLTLTPVELLSGQLAYWQRPLHLLCDSFDLPAPCVVVANNAHNTRYHGNKTLFVCPLFRCSMPIVLITSVNFTNCFMVTLSTLHIDNAET